MKELKRSELLLELDQLDLDLDLICPLCLGKMEPNKLPNNHQSMTNNNKIIINSLDNDDASASREVNRTLDASSREYIKDNNYDYVDDNIINTDNLTRNMDVDKKLKKN